MALTRRNLLSTATGALTLTLAPMRAHAAKMAEMIDVRMWPAAEYTRVTLEHSEPIEHNFFHLNSPRRLVVDIENLRLTPKLQKMISDVSPKDPYIKAIRIAQFNPQVVRLVMDLKADIRPEVFSIQPVANYRHRLIFDIYPKESEIDPIAGVIASAQDQEEDPLASVIKELEKQPDRPTVKTQVATKPTVKPTEKPTTKPVAKPAAKPTAKPTAKKSEKIVVVVDAGHGGEDPGAVGRKKTYEKHVVLAIAKRLEKLIANDKTMKCVMTRKSDHFLSLSQRVMIAQKAKAHLFVSIHADAWTKSSAKGASVYTLATRGATSSAARWLAKNQNEADFIGGANLKATEAQNKYIPHTLMDLNTDWKINYSLEFGHRVLAELGKINTLHRRQVEQAGFLVLKAPGIPSILVETAFISNPQEEKKLKTSAYQQKVAKAIYNGLRRQIAADKSLIQS